MRIKDVMDRDLTSISQDTPLLEALAMLAAHNVTGLPVLADDGDVVGFLSEKDILRATIPGYLGYMDDNFTMPEIGKIKKRVNTAGRDPAGDYMSKEPIIFDEDETIANAIVVMFKKDVRRAPVIKDDLLVGIVDREEILRGFVHDNFDDNEIEIPAGAHAERSI